MTITKERLQSHSGQMQLAILLAAHHAGLEIVTKTMGDAFPEHVLVALREHWLSGERLLKVIEASDD